MDRFHLISVFVAVVDANGFAGAARKLGISPPAVTRAISALEQQLAVRLLTRTTRTVRVTQAGERYVQDCRRILAEMADADESAAGLHGQTGGHINITAPVLFGANFVMPVVVEFLQRYPLVDASCYFLDRVVNLMDEGVDVGVRIGELPDSSMRAIRVGQVRRVIFAAPAYLAKHGTPRTPADLQAHCIVSATGVNASLDWRLVSNGVAQTIKIRPRMTTTTNDSAVQAALGGFCVSRLLSYQVDEYLNDGRLVALLVAYEPEPVPVHVIHREGRHASQKVRAFLDLAVERLRGNPVFSAATG